MWRYSSILMQAILCVWFSGGIRIPDEEGTKFAVERIRSICDVAYLHERQDTALRRLWTTEKRDIIIMEHDVVPTPSMFKEIVDCPLSWCTQHYRLYPASTNLPYEVYGTRYLGNDKELHFLKAGDPLPPTNFADAASLCFTKLSYDFRKRISPDFFKDPTLDLVNLDHKISLQAIQLGQQAHLHYPEMRHNHTTTKNEWQTVRKLVFD